MQQIAESILPNLRNNATQSIRDYVKLLPTQRNKWLKIAVGMEQWHPTRIHQVAIKQSMHSNTLRTQWR